MIIIRLEATDGETATDIETTIEAAHIPALVMLDGTIYAMTGGEKKDDGPLIITFREADILDLDARDYGGPSPWPAPSNEETKP